MISLSDTELRDSRGRPLHGRALQVAQAGERRRQAEAGREATHQAVARALVKLMARGSLSGPDVLRNLVGHDDALRILRAAGMNPGQAAASWQAEQAAPRQATAQLNGGFAGDPDHDPRVTAVMRRPGATLAEINAVRGQVAAEYAQRAAERKAHEDRYYGRDRMPAAMGASVDETGRPVQRSTIHQDVPPLGEERV